MNLPTVREVTAEVAAVSMHFGDDRVEHEFHLVAYISDWPEDSGDRIPWQIRWTNPSRWNEDVHLSSYNIFHVSAKVTGNNTWSEIWDIVDGMLVALNLKIEEGPKEEES